MSVLRRPAAMADLSLGEWDQLLVDARSTRLLGTLVADADRLGISDRLPERIAWHFEGSRVISRRHDQSVRYEIGCVIRALADVDTDILLLKGAAYRMAGLPMAEGRISGDVDILVRRDRLDAVEAALVEAGWIVADIGAANEKYYRRWLHELPPLMHRSRGSKLDVHHNILPSIDKLQVDPQRLLEKSLPLASRLTILMPEDMTLHCAAHLFRNGRYEAGLRDLLDLDRMVRHFSTEDDYWPRLVSRAEELNLRIPCFFGLRYARTFFETPIPQEVQEQLERFRPRMPPLFAMDRLVPFAVQPGRRGRRNTGLAISHWVLARYPLSLWKRTILPKVERLVLPARPAEAAETNPETNPETDSAQ